MEFHGAESIANLVTIVITTSACPVHPSTDLLDELAASIRKFAVQLVYCRKIVVCDGYLVRDKKSKFRSGRITNESAGAYEEYKTRLKQRFAEPLYVQERYEVHELAEHNGFGFAVKASLPLVRTPLIMVIQHDRSFCRSASFLQDIVQTMVHEGEDGRIGYVLLPTTSTQKYISRSLTKFHMNGISSITEADIARLAIPVGTDPIGISHSTGYAPMTAAPCLLPCFRWFDSTHVAFSQFYRDFVFDADMNLVKKGGFIEDKLGQVQQNDFLHGRGLEDGVAFWRMYLYQDGLGRAVWHMDGKRHLSDSALDAKYPCRRVKISDGDDLVAANNNE